MRSPTLGMLAVAWCACASSALARTTGPEYDAVNDFSISRNPNGPWTYLREGPDNSGPFPAFDGSYRNVTGLEAWTNGTEYKYSAYIARNSTSKPIHFETIVLPKNELLLTGHSGHTVTLRFTAPKKGVYRVKAELSGTDRREISVTYQLSAKNGKILCSGQITYYRQTFDCRRTLTLQAGDLIDLVAGPLDAGDDLHGSLGATVRIKGPLEK